MKPTDVVYYDTTGDMIKSTLGVQKTKLVRSDVGGKTLTKQLTLIDIEPCASKGVTFWFEDKVGRRYPMTDSVFAEYIKSHPIFLGEKTFEFLKQGHVYSIGFKGDEQ